MIINVIENRYSYESEFWCKDTKKIALCQEFEGSILGSILGSNANKPIPTAKERYVKFTQRSFQSHLSLIPFLKDASSDSKQAFSNRKEALRKVYATLLPIPIKPHSDSEGCIIRLQTSLTP